MYVRVYLCVCVYVPTCVRMYVCTCVHVYALRRLDVCMYECIHVCTYARKLHAQIQYVRDTTHINPRTMPKRITHTYTHMQTSAKRVRTRCLITTPPHTWIIMPSMCAREQYILCYLTPYRAFWWCSFAAKSVPRPSPYHPHRGGWEFESPQLTRRHFPARLPALRYGKMCHTRPTKKTYKRDLFTPTDRNKRDLPRNTYTHPKRPTKDTYWLPRKPRHFPARLDAQRYGKYVHKGLRKRQMKEFHL